MNRKYAMTLLLVIISAQVLTAQKKTWVIDPDHSRIQFKSVYMSITKVYGDFRDYTSTIVTEGNMFEGARIEVKIRAESIDTDNKRRDGHLRSEDFFYVEKYPIIRFISLIFKKIGENTYQLEGELTIRGVTRKETFKAIYNGMVKSEDQERAAFTVTGTLNRFDYNIDWNKSFIKGLVVGENIDIICEVSLIPEDQQADL